MMKKYLVVALISVMGNANAFFWDTVNVTDTRLNEEVKIRITKQTKWDPSPTIIILHGCDGAQQHYQNWGRIVNSWGYNAIFPDSFESRNVHNVCQNPGGVTVKQRSEDIAAIAEWINQQKWHKGKIGVIGFSHGGWSILQASNFPINDKISAMIAYYPWCHHMYYKPKIPVQIHIGLNDDWNPATKCVNLSDEYDLHTYENATHSFDIDAPPRQHLGKVGSTFYLEHNPEAFKLSTYRSKEFFKKYIGVEK
jgi:dienelactone hydrolase